MTDRRQRPFLVLGLSPLTATVVIGVLLITVLLYLPSLGVPFEGRFSFGDRTHYSWSDDDRSWELVVRGRVELTEDATAIGHLSEHGLLRLEIREPGDQRRLEVRRGKDGGLEYDYSVNRRSRPFDAQARLWLARELPEVADQTGLGAHQRARALLVAGGVEAVLERIDQLRADVARSRYYEVLIEEADLGPEAADQVAGHLAERLESDHNRAETAQRLFKAHGPQILERASFGKLIGSFESDYYRSEVLESSLSRTMSSAAVLAYLGAMGEVGSDYYRVETFDEVAERRRFDPEQRAAALALAPAFDSDYHLAAFLERLVESTPAGDALGASFFDAADRLGTDSHRASVLRTVLERRAGDPEDFRLALDSTTRMSHDFYQAELLETAARRIPMGDETTQLRWLEAGRGVESDHYLAESLSRLLDRRDLGPAVLERAAALAASQIESDHLAEELAERINGRLAEGGTSPSEAGTEVSAETPAEAPGTGEATEEVD